MKKTLMILVGLFVCLILAGVIGLSLLFVKGGALDKESKAYVDDVTPKILANLSKETLFLYASDELKRTATPEDFDKIFKLFAKLGQFKQYRGKRPGSYFIDNKIWKTDYRDI
jgi:hypothetical protein